MKTKLYVISKLFIATLSFSLFLVESNAQCVANWISSESGCYAKFGDLSQGNPTQWLWDFADGQTSNLQNPVHTYSASGTYNVCLTITAGSCSDTSCSILKISCSTTGVSSLEQINISLSFNHPVFSFADIHYSLPFSSSMELALFDIIGNKICVLENGSKRAGTYSYLLNTGSYSNGVYFIRLDFEGTTLTKKIIM